MKPMTIAVVLVCIVAGCAPQAQAQDKAVKADVIKEKADIDFKVYVSCLRSATIDYSQSAANPSEIADAAQSKCGGVFSEWETSVQKQLTYGTTTNVGFMVGMRLAESLSRDIKTQSKQKVVQWLLEIQLEKR